MNIAIVASLIVPEKSLGIEHFTYGLLNALIDQYHECQFNILISRNTRTPWIERVPVRKNMQYWEILFSPSIQESASETVSSLISNLYKALKTNKLARWLLRNIRTLEESYILHKINPTVIYYPFQRHPIGYKPFLSIVTVHDLRKLTPGLYEKEGADILRKNIQTAGAVISSWKHPFNQLIGLFPEKRSMAFEIPYPPPMARTDPLKNLTNDKELILYASVISPQKNHLRLVQALNIVFKQRKSNRKSLRLVCTGAKQSPTYEEVWAETEKLGLEKYVDFPGFVSDESLKELYAKATMIVAPTLWEGASGTVYEAFTYEKPVACSNIPPLVSQVNQSGATANFFNPYDPMDIARAILEVLNEPAKYVEGAKRGSAYLRALSWGKTAAEYMRVFKMVQKRNSHARNRRRSP